MSVGTGSWGIISGACSMQRIANRCMKWSRAGVRVRAFLLHVCQGQARTHHTLSGMQIQSQTRMRAVGLFRLTNSAVSQLVQYLHRATVGHRHNADSACQCTRCGMYARGAGLCACMDACGNQTDQWQAISAGAKTTVVRAHQLGVPVQASSPRRKAVCTTWSVAQAQRAEAPPPVPPVLPPPRSFYTCFVSGVRGKWVFL